ncbi:MULTISPECIES: TMEM175 family protein [unclassified Frigoribacterium]|uniref:TMEM175 family protein n=1 Tax=unclassified Frigoribacterium TaxID=2627005 RepID=UPI0006F38C9E|nr:MULTISPECIES: TMEM175 family protein [unclassified Frigoribacterium]KQO47544.1 hypothetical protein ASF07_08575 [Frigoribacterium sp. Leaf254]KQT39637.1 hypothetical protein ASG28_08580 [Frigoribacterium sp. Leaf415]
MRSERGFDRLVNFSDAVVAIAITLIVLPLVDAAGADQHETAGAFLSDNVSSLAAAALSFVVIGALWRAHHRVWDGFSGVSTAMVHLNFFWLASIVFLPLPTVLIESVTSNDRLSVGLYVGTMLVSAISLALHAVIAERDGLLSTEALAARRARPWWDRWSTVLLMTVVFVVAVLVPQIGLAALTALLLAIPAGFVARRRTRVS